MDVRRVDRDRQLPELSKTHRVIVLDLPGHGRSAPPQGGAFSMAQFARAVEAVRQAAGVDKAVLVGHSMGATVITRYAQEYPSRVVALVLGDGLLASPEMLPRLRELVMPAATDPARRREAITSMFSPATTPTIGNRILTMMLAPRRPRLVAPWSRCSPTTR